MAVRDQVSLIDAFLLLDAAISTDTTTAGAILDTADYEMGLSFFMAATAWTDGAYALLLQESDDSGMSGAVTIDSSKLIEALPTALGAATASDGVYAKVGVFSNLRYVRASIVSTGTTTGATISMFAIQGAEQVP